MSPGRDRGVTLAWQDGRVLDESIINLTPHPIVIVAGDLAGTYPSQGCARVIGLPDGPVVDLPPERPTGPRYIVSVIVAERLPDRSDLLVPGMQVRDDEGRIVGAADLVRPQKASPALALLSRPGALWIRHARAYGAIRIRLPGHVQPGESGIAVAYDKEERAVAITLVETNDTPIGRAMISHGEILEGAEDHGMALELVDPIGSNLFASGIGGIMCVCQPARCACRRGCLS